jgi:choline dehydrogenase-like flavoprotein
MMSKKSILRSHEKVDVLIVGSGAAASVYAAKAAKAGKQVSLLEAGPAHTMNDMISSQIWARRLKWGGAFVEEEGDHKVGNPFNSGWGTGGSAKHHFGVWPRLHANDFKTQSNYGVGYDWPLEYQDLQPYYDQIQTEVGVSGDAAQEKWRPEGEPYPMPPLPIFAQGEVISKGFEALGKHTAPIPLAINSREYNGRKACIYDGWCDAGCPTGALANPLAVYLPQAKKYGAQIKHESTVSRVLTNANGDRAIGVEYFDNEGHLHQQLADVVVLAAFAIQNPRLLLLSANDQKPNGLANSSGMVGKCLMTHPAHTINGLFKEETQPHFGVTGGQLINQDGYDNKQALKEAYGSYQWLIANAVKPNDLLGIANSRPDIFGEKLDGFMKEAARHFGTMVCVAEDMPVPENQVSLSQQKDQFGLPIAKATHNIQAATKTLCDHVVKEGLAVFKAAGSKESWAGPRAGMHLMGGTIMGDDRNKSVTNRYGQCHDIDNLFVAGPGLFPSSGAVNPTFTLHALSLLSVEYLLKQWSGIVV